MGIAENGWWFSEQPRAHVLQIADEQMRVEFPYHGCGLESI